MTVCDTTEGERATLQPSPAIWLTAADVAEQLKLGIKVIYRAVKRGRLRAARIDGRGLYRFRQEWVDAWVESCVTPTERGRQ